MNEFLAVLLFILSNVSGNFLLGFFLVVLIFWGIARHTSKREMEDSWKRLSERNIEILVKNRDLEQKNYELSDELARCRYDLEMKVDTPNADFLKRRIQELEWRVRDLIADLDKERSRRRDAEATSKLALDMLEGRTHEPLPVRQ